MQQKVLSVSVAAYNAAATLREALEPFTADGVRERVEVLVVNDGSKDNTPEIAQEYQDRFPGTFRLISKENGGWGSTLNTGIRAATGKYFKQLDADDYYSKENLPDFLDFLEKTDADMAYSPFVTFEDQSGGIYRIVGELLGDYRFFPTDRVIPLSECENFVPAMHTLTVRTSVLQNSDIFITEHCFYTDVEFVLKSYHLCKTVAFYKMPVYYYRLARDGQSMSLAGVRKHYRDHEKMLLTMLEYYTENVMDKATQQAFENRLESACIMQYVFFFALKCTASEKNELIEFDTILREKYPEFYEKTHGPRLDLLRKMNFFGYRLLARQKMRQDKRLRQNIFEGD